MDAPIRVIAWGNKGRSDDGAALRVLEALRRRLRRGDVALDEYHQLGPELVEDLARCRLAVFLDAYTGARRAAVVCRRVRAGRHLPMASHHCSPPELLALADALGYPVPRAYLVAIRATDFEFGDRLSADTEKACRCAVRHVRRIIAAYDAGQLDGPRWQRHRSTPGATAMV